MSRRLDQELISRGLVSDIKVARALILAGKILVDDHPQTKVGISIAKGASLRIRKMRRFVSRAGEKLYNFCKDNQIRFDQKKVLDVGASTGGFTQVVLQLGATQVFSVDVGYGQMDHQIASDPRVKVIDRTPIAKLPPMPQVTTFVMDVSFTSSIKTLAHLEKILPLRILASSFSNLNLKPTPNN